MELETVETDRFISAIIHQNMGGEMVETPLTQFKAPEEGIEDVQEFLREEFLKRMQPMINSAIESIRGSIIESILNATFTDIHYHEHKRKMFKIKDNETNINFDGWYHA